MTAAATIAALPAAWLVLRGLLRSPSLADHLVAHPNDARWHDRATPTFGGVGIFVGLFVGVAAAVVTGAVGPGLELLGILAGTALLFAAGLVDDVRHLSPLMKLATQFAAFARLAPRTDEGEYSFLCTGDPEAFRMLGTRFLQLPMGDVVRVDLSSEMAA